MPTDFPAELISYASELFVPEDKMLSHFTTQAAKAGLPADWEISPDVGRFFQILCRAISAKHVIECGTLAGHSALWFTRGIPMDGHVTSIEIDPGYAEVALKNLEYAGVSERVTVKIGAVAAVLPQLAEEVDRTGNRHDVLFLDADKPKYLEFLMLAERLLRPGGLLLADNVLRSGTWDILTGSPDNPRTEAMREFNATLANHPKFTSMIVPMRAGIVVAIYNGN